MFVFRSRLRYARDSADLHVPAQFQRSVDEGRRVRHDYNNQQHSHSFPDDARSVLVPRNGVRLPAVEWYQIPDDGSQRRPLVSKHDVDDILRTNDLCLRASCGQCNVRALSRLSRYVTSPGELSQSSQRDKCTLFQGNVELAAAPHIQAYPVPGHSSGHCVLCVRPYRKSCVAFPAPSQGDAAMYIHCSCCRIRRNIVANRGIRRNSENDNLHTCQQFCYKFVHEYNTFLIERVALRQMSYLDHLVWHSIPFRVESSFYV